MQTKTLGTLTTSTLGLGCMGMSGPYGESNRTESNATVHAALDAGIALLDTGDFYGMGVGSNPSGGAGRPRRRRPLPR